MVIAADGVVVNEDLVVEELCGDAVLGGVLRDLVSEEEVGGVELVRGLLVGRARGCARGRYVAEDEGLRHAGGVDGGGEEVSGVE